MFRKNTLLISLILVLFGLVLLLSFGQAFARPIAQADPTPEWDEGRQVTLDATPGDSAIPSAPTTPGTFYRTFSGTRFQPTASSMTYSPIGGAVYALALPPGGFSFSLDFDLPHGVTITEVVFFVIDNDATNMNLSLRSYNPETDAFITLESGLSSGASTTLQTIVIAVDPPILVNNTTTSYRLRVAPGVATSSHLLRGARIGYTLPTTYISLVNK